MIRAGAIAAGTFATTDASTASCCNSRILGAPHRRDLPHMAATLIDGKAQAAALRHQIKIDTAALVDQTGVRPGLAVVLIGDAPASPD